MTPTKRPCHDSARILPVECDSDCVQMRSAMKKSVLVLATALALMPSTFRSQALSVPVPAPPVVTIAAVSVATSEGGGDPGRFTIKRSGSTVLPLIVFYRVGGTAANGIDYARLLPSTTIPAGSLSADIEVKAVDDQIAENDETVILTLISPI